MGIHRNIPASVVMGATFMGLLAVGPSSASGETLSPKPIENADGNLSFEGLSDRQLLEFTANQVWLLNRRPSSEIRERIRSLNDLVDETARKAVQAYLPNTPEETDSFGKYLYWER
jgi:hypothetical protein